MVVLILIAIPILEIVTAAVVAHLIGWWPTIGLLVLASLLGIWQLKIQGLGAWRRGATSSAPVARLPDRCWMAASDFSGRSCWRCPGS